MATLVEVGTEQLYQLQERTSIGRDRRCDICVDDPMVSTSHAEIVRDVTGAYRLRDLGSRRGTFVGERQVDEIVLHDGDELLIGPARMRFQLRSVSPIASSPEVRIDATGAASGIDELTRLRAIAELSRAIGVEHDLRKVLGRVLDACFQLLAADRGAICVFQPRSKTPQITIARERSGEDSHFVLSTTVVSVVMETLEPRLSAEIDADAALQRSASLSVHSVRSLMAAPLLYRADDVELLGLIQLDSRADVEVFLPRDLELLSVIAGQAALAVKNAMLVRQVRTAVEDDWRHLARVVRDLPTGVIVLDRDGRCRIANDWVLSRGSLLGAIEPGAIVATVAGIPRERLCAAEQRLAVAVAPRAFEIATQTSSDDGETVIVIADNTDELEQLTQAAHRDRLSLVGQLAGGIAHDFNNLLSVMLTYAHMLEDAVTEPTMRSDVQTIIRAATSASQLSRQLLMFSRREIVIPRVIDPAAVVRDLERMLRRTLGERIALTCEIAAAVPHVLIDRAQLEQIAVNLVVNARDAIVDQGRVQLRLSDAQLGARAVGQLAAGGYAVLEVEDTGSGMTPEVLAHIFEPYFTTKALQHGTGLGLATVQAIVSQAHGEIAVTSEPGRGTTFRIYLPETDRPLDADPIAATATAAAYGGGTVLVVDDDEDVRRMVERVLRRADYTVLTATSGPEALTRARGHAGDIDLLLTDIVMPGMTGQELVRELAAERPGLQVVFMSGFHQGAPIDSRQFVAKPFDRATLLAKVADVLAGGYR
ncbi:MAG: response regulator [Deltaproteobacteria bacterium]|nr:MAG: response regulator [Deltaproteobacteria bacterium]